MFLPKGSIISVDAGHNCTPDGGAVGIRLEDDLTKEVVGILISKLSSKGYNVVDCTPYGKVFNSVTESLAYRVNKANAVNSSVHLCIHFNKFNGTARGSEAWIDSAAGNEAGSYATQILSQLSKMGFVNRGVKVGDLYVPKYTKMPCVLVEVCFIDNQDDMNLYNANSIADAIIKGVTGETSAIRPSIIYRANIAKIGWQGYVPEGGVSGTEGRSLAMESFIINVRKIGRIVIEGHVQNIGWQGERSDGEVIGTVGKDLRLEAVKIRLFDAPGYGISYQAHVQSLGWLPYVSNGEIAGTTGRSLRLEALRIKIINQ